MLRKDKTALRSHMSAFTAAIKGSLIGNIGDDVGPKAPGSGANSYQQINPGAVRGKSYGRRKK